MSFQGVSLRTCFIFLLFVIEAVVNLSSATHHHSGLYVDNEQDQMTNHSLTTKEKLALEHTILKRLNLTDKPIDTNAEPPLMNGSALNFLRNIYNRLNEKSQQKRNRSEEFDFSKQELSMIDQSDDIISFKAQQSHKGAGGKPDKVNRVWFDVSAVPESEEVISAQLRLYRGSVAENRTHRAFNITVYRVTGKNNGTRKAEFVDSVISTAGQKGWITLNVTESLRYWMTNVDKNKGFYLDVNTIDKPHRKINPESIGIVGFKGDVEYHLFMVGFFKGTDQDQMQVSQPTIKSLDRGSSRTIRRDVSNAVHNSKELCKLRTLYVSFKDLDWQDWMIAPQGYDAYFCDGECKFPFTTHLDVSNHAIIQSLVHLLQPLKAPNPCCRPAQLSPMRILYLKDNTVFMKTLKNMVAKNCGCY